MILKPRVVWYHIFYGICFCNEKKKKNTSNYLKIVENEFYVKKKYVISVEKKQTNRMYVIWNLKYR